MKKYILQGLFIFLGSVVCAGTVAQRSTVVKEIAPYCYPENAPARADIVFMADGKSYVERSADGRKLVVRDITTGKETETIFDAGHTREAQIDGFDGFRVSDNARRILLWRNPQAVYRRSFTAEYYVYEVRSRILRPLSTEHKRQSEPHFSPDARAVAFVADNNIYMAKLDYNTEVAVTTDGKAGEIINGATDWTYEEEFGRTSLMAWSPDNLTFAYVRFDESRVPLYNLPLYQGTCSPMNEYEFYPGTLSYKYPVAGQPNSKVSLHTYDVETRKTKQMTFPGGEPYYIPFIKYGPDESTLIVATLNRDQNRYEIFKVNPRSTVSKSIFTDNSKAWIEPMAYENLYLGDKSFFVASDADGYTRYYEYTYAGAKVKTVTPAKVDATDFYGTDALGNAYYQAAAPSPLERTVYRTGAKGTVALSKTDGYSSAVFSPGCTAMSLTYSNVETPPVTALCRADGKQLRVLEDNKALAAKTAGKLQKKEFFTMRADDGTELNGYMVKPSDFNESGRYPVIMSQYSGPGSQQVLRRWTFDWEQYYASKGYIIVCVDGRGTGGRGAAFRTAVYRHLGQYETLDQLAAARYCASLPYVAPGKIGIYGWSYGGYQALMCATADGCPYAAAVAVAPVTDWRFYDTVYTERYMLTPQQNETGYNEASVLLRALHLGCPVLTMYGTADDNVHPANTLQFVSRLQSAGILSDMYVFPNMNHSINGCNARAVVYGRMFEYFNRYLR